MNHSYLASQVVTFITYITQTTKLKKKSISYFASQVVTLITYKKIKKPEKNKQFIF